MPIDIPMPVMIKVGDLQVDGNNPNKMKRAELDALKDNIQRYGFTNPIITNKDLLIADGEHRLKAAKSLGMKEVPVIKLEIGEVDRRMLRIIQNKLRGKHDPDDERKEILYISDEGDIDLFKKLSADDEYVKAAFLARKEKDPKNAVECNHVWRLESQEGQNKLIVTCNICQESYNAIVTKKVRAGE